MRTLINGLIAGAAGTTALNATTYLDMAIRARGGSSTPEDTVQKLADGAHISLGEEEEKAENRKQGIGALMGYGTGIGAALAYGAITRRRGASWPVGILTLGTLALLGSNVPMTALGITDPREWSVAGWVSDIVPHMDLRRRRLRSLRTNALTPPGSRSVPAGAVAPFPRTRPRSRPNPKAHTERMRDYLGGLGRGVGSADRVAG